jgi:type II secretory pathway pseudopilin PulG
MWLGWGLARPFPEHQSDRHRIGCQRRGRTRGHHMMQKKFRRGFTLIEAAAVTAIGTLVAATLAPGLKATRLNAQARGSESNLMQIGQGSDMYALDNAGRIFTYNWVPGETYLMPDGKTRRILDDGDSGSWQNTEILMRRTGRIDGPDRFRNYGSRLAHSRLRHIVLMDYLGTQFPDTLFADPADANLLQWQANPTDISAANNIPYAAGSDFSGYDDPGGWTDVGVRQRWPFASSYQSPFPPGLPTVGTTKRPTRRCPQRRTCSWQSVPAPAQLHRRPQLFGSHLPQRQGAPVRGVRPRAGRQPVLRLRPRSPGETHVRRLGQRLGLGRGPSVVESGHRQG